MRQAVHDHHVRQLRTQLVVGFRFFAFLGVRELLGFLYRVGREERCVVTALTHGQGDEAFVSHFVFATVGDQHLGRNLGFQLAEGFERVNRKIFHRTTALRADDVRAPAVLREAFGQACRQQVGGVAPQVMLVVAGHVFLVVEAAYRVFRGIIRHTQQEAR